MKAAQPKTDAFAKARAAKAAKATLTGDGGPPLSTEQMDQREKAFVIYRDLGKTRTLHRLATVLKQEHPDIAVTRVTLERWSKRHGWVNRIVAFEQGIAIGQAPLPMPVKIEVDKAFNQIDALMAAAQMALTKAMKANPTVTRPGDVKILVDAAANAMKLVEQLQSQQAGKGVKEEVAAEIGKTLDLIEVARRKDTEFIVRAAAKAAADASGQPIEPIFQAAALAAGLRIDSAAPAQVVAVELLQVDHDESTDSGEAIPVMVDRVSSHVVETVARFADVLAQFGVGDKR